MLFIRNYKSNLKGQIKYLLSALPKEAKEAEKFKDIAREEDIKELLDIRSWLQFVMKNEKAFEEIRQGLNPFGLAKIMKGCIFAGALSYRKDPKNFFLREIFVSQEEEKPKESEEEQESIFA